MKIRLMRGFVTLVGVSCLLLGCQQQRTVTIVTKPEDAMIKINGVDYGRGPVTHQFVYPRSDDVHRVTASRLGFKEETVQLTRDNTPKIVELELKPQTREIHIAVNPVPAYLRIDGELVSDSPVQVHSEILPFTVDQRNIWTSYTVTAEREGFRPAQAKVTWTDRSNEYTLTLEPMVKDLQITSEPTGAEVYLSSPTLRMEEQLLGTTPLIDPERPFFFDTSTNEFVPYTMRLRKPGFDDVTMEIGWDDGRGEYHVDFSVKQKVVRIRTDPPGAQVEINGVQPQSRDANATVYNLQFPPINDQGDLTTYEGVARKEQKDAEWEPRHFTIAWDDKQEDYLVELKEIVTRPVALIVASMRREGGAWECVPEELETLAVRDPSEPPGREQPEPVVQLDRGTSIGSMALAPDGSYILYTILTGSGPEDFRSQMQSIRTDGTGSAVLTDGKSLDITPSFSPGGDRILFSSNRAGRRMQIWSMSARGEHGVSRHTITESNDIWPSLDSDPKPRLFYQSMVDTRPDPRIYMTPLGSAFPTDLTVLSGTQPRVSPRNDAVLFCSPHEQTNKRDIWRMTDRGGEPQNLTNTPDADDCDPVWSRDGRRVAYASDRGLDAEGRRNYDIWVLDLARPEQPTQITVNGSVDDSPMFSPTGDAIYFRSNRGGRWGIWKMNLR